ncbi:MAG: choice-of-anchor A family protein, partial [Chromatocurvus sp.]
EFNSGRMYSGNAVVKGTHNNFPNVGFYPDEDPGVVSGTLRNETLSHFHTIGGELIAKSNAWGAWQPNGQVTKDNHGNITFEGEGKRAVFNLCAPGDPETTKHAICTSGLQDVNSLLFDIPRYTTAVINVFNTEVTLSALGFHHTAIARLGKEGQVRGDHNKMPDNQPGEFRHNGELTNRILFNFVNATSLTMNAIGFKGSVLAPNANVNFFNGHIDGNLIAGSLSAPDLSGMTLDQIRANGDAHLLSGQINNYRFMDVPAPSTLSAFALGLLLLGLQGWRGRLASRRQDTLA